MNKDNFTSRYPEKGLFNKNEKGLKDLKTFFEGLKTKNKSPYAFYESCKKLGLNISMKAFYNFWSLKTHQRNKTIKEIYEFCRERGFDSDFFKELIQERTWDR